MDSAGSKSVISDDMQELNQGQENISNSVQGHKANLSNPNTSEKSKQNSAAVIDALGDVAHYGNEDNPQSKSAAKNLEGSRAA